MTPILPDPLKPALPDPLQFLCWLEANGFTNKREDTANFATVTRDGHSVLVPLNMRMPLAAWQLQAAVNAAVAILVCAECPELDF